MRSIAEVRLQEGQPGALLAVVRDADARRADDPSTTHDRHAWIFAGKGMTEGWKTCAITTLAKCERLLDHELVRGCLRNSVQKIENIRNLKI
jgi:hypothetical protein